MSSPTSPSEAAFMKRSYQPNRRPWWSRQSRGRKLLLMAIPLVLIIALAVGLGVGLTEGKDDTPTPSKTTSPVLPTYPAVPTSTIWQPEVNSSWQIVLQNPISLDTSATSVTPDVSIFDIDLFTNPTSTIETLHRLQKRVICYFSAGSFEPNRPDSAQFKDSDKGKELDGWPGEKWLNLKSGNVRNIMIKRIELAAQKGCDGIDPDNVDGYQNENGLNLSEEDSVDFMAFLAAAATNHSLAIGLKNAGDIVPSVLNVTHFSVNEQCVEYGECDDFAPYIEAGKPVFHIEYPKSAPSTSSKDRQDLCSHSGKGKDSEDFSTVLKKIDLDGWVQFCNGDTANTNVATSPPGYD